jgi:hypothetical protein
VDGFRSILLPVPEADDLVDTFRREGDWSHRHGVPAHLTLAGPFSLSVALPPRALGELASELRGTGYELTSVGLLGSAVCLFPADDAPFLEWREQALRAVDAVDRIDDEWRVHLTVGRFDASTLEIDRIVRSLEEELPIACEVGDLLIAEVHGDGRVSLRPPHIR